MLKKRGRGGKKGGKKREKKREREGGMERRR